MLMRVILLSVKPEYVEAILNGSKLFEYRKRIPQRKVDKIIIYSTSPVKSVVGDVCVTGILSDHPNPLWEKTKNNSGISRTKYYEYFKGCKIAYAFQLGDVTKFVTPKTLSEYGIKCAPQSFVCLKSEI
jgi:predicted transcriptional regulator